MKRSLCLVGLSMLFCPLLACGAPGAGASALAGDADAARMAAYRTALEGIYYDHVLPDGRECDDPKGEAECAFAVYDMDQDGRAELMVWYEGASTAGKTVDIYDCSDESGALYQEFSAYPMLTFYDNGIIRALWAHNQGVAGENFWPYSMYQYDEGTDTYQIVGMADAWDCTLTRSHGGQVFPRDADVDGDGMVYYVMSGEGYDNSSPVDGLAYEQWENTLIGGAQVVDVDWTPLTKKAMAALS